MNKQHVRLIMGLGLVAWAEMVVGRVVLPVVRRRWQSYAGLPALETAELILVAALAGGALYFIWHLAWRERALAERTPLSRKFVHVFLATAAIAAAAAIVWPGSAEVDLGRHLAAVLVIVSVAAYALLRAHMVARAAVGMASVALLCATLYRAALEHSPDATSVQWLAALSEMVYLTMPWVIAVAIVRRRRVDLISAGVGVLFLSLDLVLSWTTMTPARLLVAQAQGFRFLVSDAVHALAVGAFAYVATKMLISVVLPREIAWAYIWLTACGIQMYKPHVQIGALVAMAIVALAPPPSLPPNMKRTIPGRTGNEAESEEPTAPDESPPDAEPPPT